MLISSDDATNSYFNFKTVIDSLHQKLVSVSTSYSWRPRMMTETSSNVWIPSIWTRPLLLTLFQSSIYWWMALAWCCSDDLAFVGADFHAVTSVCLLQPSSQSPRKSTSSAIHNLQSWTLTTVGYQLLHFLTNYLQIDRIWLLWCVKLFCLSFSKIN